MEEEDKAEREAGLPSSERSRQVARTTGQFLFALVAPQTDCEVLEIGGSRGYSTIWLGAGVRHLGGRVLSLEHDPAKCEAWRRNIARGRARGDVRARRGRRLPDDPRDRRRLRRRVPRRREGPVRRAVRTRAPEARAGCGRRCGQRPLPRRPTRGVLGGTPGRPDAESVTVPIDRGIELSVVLTRAW